MRHGIRINHSIDVVGFKYRTAQTKKCILSMDADKKLHSELASKAKIAIDNHQTFVLVEENGNKIVIQFSDEFMFIGTDVKIGVW